MILHSFPSTISNMFEPNDAEYLERVLGENKVVLFLGAGFSRDATNRAGQPMPLSADASEKLWEFLRYEENYDGTSLPDMYEAVLQSGAPFDRITSFMEHHFLTRDIPESYDVLAAVFWHRIYTTNIDDLLKRVYKRCSGPALQVLAYPDDEVRERDPSLERIQAIHLHGALPCRPDEITFSVRQYARRAIETSSLYDQFVGDYATLPVVFVGTELNEQLFWQHIEARERRSRDISEQRPKSFLICPRISPPKRTQLRAFNVIPVEAHASDFLEWLSDIAGELPDREAVLHVTLPSIVALLSAAKDRTNTADLQQFAKAFHLVPSALEVRGDRSFFLLGATPRWEDIFRGLDAPRDTTDDLLSYITEVLTGADRPRVIALLGSAGSGKSTILRRLGVRLAQQSVATFLSNSEELPPPTVAADALQSFGRESVLLFDNAEVALGAMAGIVEATENIQFPPVIVIASRMNEFDRRSARLEKVTAFTDFEVPNLSRPEIAEVLRVLESEGLLGYLQGLPDQARIEEFTKRAGSQLLVAMREATSGKGFDQIIHDEFASLPTIESKLLYLCVALSTEAGYRITRQQFVRCSDTQPAEALHILERTLKGIVIHTGPQKDLLLLRHRLIAEHMLGSAAPRTLLGDAYVRILSTLSGEVLGAGIHSRTFGLYRELVNHQKVFERFASNLEDARAIYDSIAGRLSSEAHFWLQYGLLELEFGNLQLAENYLKQAESLHPRSNYIQNSIGLLYFRHGLEADSESIAYHFRREGSEILERQMDVDDSPYPFHTYCSQRLSWAKRWIRDRQEMKRELEHLREVLQRARKAYGRNRKLRGLQEHVERDYLSLSIDEVGGNRGD